MQVLRLEPADNDALQTKLFLLLQTEQYSAALALADSAGHAFKFGRAYSLYRLHREHEAAVVLDGIKSTAGSNRGVNHLEAQLVCTVAVPSLVHIFFISELHFHRTTDKAPIRLHSICITTSLTRLKRYALAPSIHLVRLRFSPSTFIAIR